MQCNYSMVKGTILKQQLFICLQSVEAKHKTSLYINQALETHILEVYREIEELKTKVTKQGKYS